MEVLFRKSYPITSLYGPRSFYLRGVLISDFHLGVDFGTPTGTPLHSPIAGRIQYGQDRYGGLWMDVFNEKERFRFVHMSKIMQRVNCEAGDLIAYTGNTGFSSGPHTHVEYWEKGRRITPLARLNLLNQQYMSDIKLREFFKSFYGELNNALSRDRADYNDIVAMGVEEWFIAFGFFEIIDRIIELGRYEEVSNAEMNPVQWYIHNGTHEYESFFTSNKKR